MDHLRKIGAGWYWGSASQQGKRSFDVVFKECLCERIQRDGSPLYVPHFPKKLAVEKNSSNAIAWVASPGVKVSNDLEVLTVVHMCLTFIKKLPVVSNPVPLLGLPVGLWKFHFLLNEIKTLSSLLQVEFKHILHSANGVADSLAKKRVDCLVPLLDLFM